MITASELRKKIEEYYALTGADREAEDAELLQAMQNVEERNPLGQLTTGERLTNLALGTPRTIAQGVIGLAGIANRTAEAVVNPFLKLAGKPPLDFRPGEKYYLDALEFENQAPQTTKEAVVETGGKIAQALVPMGAGTRVGRAIGNAANLHPEKVQALSQALGLSMLGQGDTEATAALGAEGALASGISSMGTPVSKSLTMLATGLLGGAGSYFLNEEASPAIHAVAGVASGLTPLLGANISENFQKQINRIAVKPAKEWTEADKNAMYIASKHGFDISGGQYRGFKPGVESENRINWTDEINSRLKTAAASASNKDDGVSFLDDVVEDSTTPSILEVNKYTPISSIRQTKQGNSAEDFKEILMPPSFMDDVKQEEISKQYKYPRLGKAKDRVKDFYLSQIAKPDLLAGTATGIASASESYEDDGKIDLAQTAAGFALGLAGSKAFRSIPWNKLDKYVPSPKYLQPVENKRFVYKLPRDPEAPEITDEYHLLKSKISRKKEVVNVSRLLKSIRQKASTRTGKINGVRYVIVVDGKPIGIRNLVALEKELKKFPIESVAKTYKNENNQIIVDFDDVSTDILNTIHNSKGLISSNNSIKGSIDFGANITGSSKGSRIYHISKYKDLPDIKDEYHLLEPIESDYGLKLDTSLLLKSVKSKSSKIKDKVYGKKYAIIADNEKIEVGTLSSLEDKLQGFSSNSIAKVYKNGNNQIVIDFDDVNKTVENAIRYNKVSNFKSIEGSVIPEMGIVARALTGAVVGAPVGASMNPDDPISGAKSGALVGMFAGGLGLPAIKTFADIANDVKVKSATSAVSKAKNMQSLKEVFDLKTEELVKAGLNPSDSASAMGRFIRQLEKTANFNLPQSVKNAAIQSKGMAAHMVEKIQAKVASISVRANYTEDFKKLANSFLDGEISLDQFRSLATTQDEKVIVETLQVARESIDALSEMVAKAVQDKDLQIAIRENKGKYLSNTFKLFTQDKWRPSESAIDAVVSSQSAREILKMPDATDEQIRMLIRSYIEEVKATKGTYLFSSTDYGKKIDKSIYSRRKPLTPEWREMLGEVKDPLERVYNTVARLYGNAVSSNFFNKMRNQTLDGVPAFFENHSALTAFREGLKTKLGTAITEVERARIQKQLATLDTFYALDNNVRFGQLRSGLVHRHVWDQLDTWDNLTNPVKGPLVATYLNGLSAIKLAKTAYNPVLIARQFITAPLFAVYGKTDLESSMNAWKMLFGKDKYTRNPAIAKELVENGIITADFIRGEFYQTVKRTMPSSYTPEMESIGINTLAKWKGALAKGHQSVLEFYRFADNWTRVSVYLAAKKRFAQELGKSIDDIEVITRAMEHTNRYTPNYDTVAPMIRWARNMPFFNVFLTYQAETLRIAGNLVADLADPRKRIHAALSLSLMAGAGNTFLSLAKNTLLTEKEREEWERFRQLLPDYARYRRLVPLRKDRNGDWHYIDITPIETHESFTLLFDALKNGDIEAAAAVNPIISWQNSPFLNIVHEQIGATDLQTKEIAPRPTLEKRMQFLLNDLVPPHTPLFGSGSDELISAFSRNKDGSLGVTNIYTGRRQTPLQYISTLLTGFKTGVYRPRVYEDRVIKDFSRQEAHARFYLRKVLSTDAPEEVKLKAIDNYKRTVAILITSTEERLGRIPITFQ